MSDSALRRLYDQHLLPHLIDCACGMKDVMRERQKIVPLAHGRVLEIGIGTGLNLAYYDRSKINSLCGLDPAAQMQGKAQKRVQAAGLEVQLVPLSAEIIPEGNGSFDCIVCTFTLCSIPDPAGALHEMHRVLKPDGLLLFSEHGLAPDVSVQGWQNRLTPVWKHLAGGCHLNRDVPTLLETSGFRVIQIEQKYLEGPKPLTWVSTGQAIPV